MSDNPIIWFGYMLLLLVILGLTCENNMILNKMEKSYVESSSDNKAE